MKSITFYLLLAALLGITVFLSFAQQNQNTQKPNPEIETLKIQLQTVENEKIELTTKLRDAEAKLAEANAKLINAEFGKLERELRDSNDAWLRTWSTWFIAIIAVVVTILCAIGTGAWSRFKSKADQLIADEVEKNFDGFKEAMAQVDILKNQLREASTQVNTLQNQIKILEEEHAASVLENFVHSYIGDVDSHPEQIRALRGKVLLQVFGDETRLLEIRCKAVEILADRKSPLLVAPMLAFLNLVVDSDFDWETSIDGERLPYRLVSFVGRIYTDEAHQGLKKFLDRLLTENPEHKDLFLTWTVSYLVDIDVELGVEDSVSMIKKAIPNLDNLQQLPHVVGRLVEYFNTFNEPEGIKDILTNGLTDRIPEVETQCLALLQKHDPKFVEEWQAQKETANTQNEESE